MRKPSVESKARELRLSDYVLKRHVRALRQRRSCKRRLHLLKKPKDGKTRIKHVTIVAPNKIIFHGDESVRNTFRQFISDISGKLGSEYRVKIDLSKVELLLPCGVLLLLSQVRGWTLKFPGKLSANYPSDEVVEQMLQSVGILEKLGLPERVTVSREEVTRWYHFKGESADASQMTPFMQVAKERLGEADQSALYDSIVEAITNVTHHAYDDDEQKRWWMFASLTKTEVFVSIYDAGRSIPGTLLEKPGVRDQIKSWCWGKKKRDSRMLHAAMGGKSRTKLCYRGKGLPEMLESTMNMIGSSLAIYSRRGLVLCDSGADREVRTELTEPVDGTLLLWALKTAKD